MKRKSIIVLLFCLFQTVASLGQGNARIVFYREKSMQGSGATYKIFKNDSLLVRLFNGSYFEFSCPPGEYTFSVNNIGGPGIRLNAEAGQTYYVMFALHTSFWTSYPQLILVEGLSAEAVIQNKGLYKIESANARINIPNNRLAVFSASGLGFENTPMITSSDGKEATLSFGGGFSIGLKYGYEISRHFDLAFDICYQGSDLSPYLSNASMTYARAILELTPSLVIPVSEDNMKRLKLGGGISYYTAAKLSIDTKEISGGFNDEWNYNNSVGLHTNVVYESNFSIRWSGFIGLKCYFVNYEFKSGSTTYPVDDELTYPNGSGIDLQLGLSYHF